MRYFKISIFLKLLVSVTNKTMLYSLPLSWKLQRIQNELGVSITCVIGEHGLVQTSRIAGRFRPKALNSFIVYKIIHRIVESDKLDEDVFLQHEIYQPSRILHSVIRLARFKLEKCVTYSCSNVKMLLHFFNFPTNIEAASPTWEAHPWHFFQEINQFAGGEGQSIQNSRHILVKLNPTISCHWLSTKTPRP